MVSYTISEGVFMKRFSFVLAILALALTFGLVFASCDNGTTGGGNTSRVQGTYYTSDGFGSFVFTGSNFTIYFLGLPLDRGTFTVSGDTVTLTFTYVTEYSDIKVEDKYILTIIDERTLGSNETGEFLRK